MMAATAVLLLPSWASRPAGYGRRGLGTLAQVVSTITATEGARPTLNNPGNLIYVGQAGASPSSYSFVGSDGRTYYFAQFDTLDDGTAALQNQIQLDASRGMTVAQFAASYAPAGSGNNPTAYAQYIADAAGVSVNDPLTAALASSPGAAPDVSSIISGDGDGSTFDLSSLLPSLPDLSSIDPTVLTGVAIGGALLLALFLVNR